MHLPYIEINYVIADVFLFLCAKIRQVSAIPVLDAFRYKHYPPTSEASREVANLTERKNPYTPFI